MLSEKDIEFSMYDEKWRIKTKDLDLALFKQISDPFGEHHWKLVVHHRIGKESLNNLILESFIHLFFMMNGKFVDFDKKIVDNEMDLDSTNAFSINSHERSELELEGLRGE